MLAINLAGRAYSVTSYCSTINRATVSYQYWRYLFYRKIHLLRFIYCYCTLIYVINSISLCFVCNHHRTFIFLQNLNQFLLWYLQTQFVLQINKSTTYQFLSTQHRKHWKTEPYWGSADCGEGDHNSDINHLGSDNFRKCTTVTNQC